MAKATDKAKLTHCPACGFELNSEPPAKAMNKPITDTASLVGTR